MHMGNWLRNDWHACTQSGCAITEQPDAMMRWQTESHVAGSIPMVPPAPMVVLGPVPAPARPVVEPIVSPPALPAAPGSPLTFPPHALEETT
jgi:hypothetical protein